MQSQQHSNEQIHAEAETEYRPVIKLREKVLGVEHPDTLQTCFNLAGCLRAESKMQEAKAFAKRAAEGALRVLGPENPLTVGITNNSCTWESGAELLGLKSWIYEGASLCGFFAHVAHLRINRKGRLFRY